MTKNFITQKESYSNFCVNLKHRIELLRKKEIKDEYGSREEVLEEIASLMSCLMKISKIANKSSGEDTIFVTRFHKTYQKANIIRYKDENYQIVRMVNHMENNKYLIIYTSGK